MPVNQEIDYSNDVTEVSANMENLTTLSKYVNMLYVFVICLD